MTPTPETPGIARARLLFVAVVSVLLLALAHGAAELQGYLDAGKVGGHSTLYYRIVFTIWVADLLLIPALCFHVFSRPESRNSYWLGFWTWSYVAYMIHFFWTVVVMFGLDFGDLFHSQEGVAANPERVVQHPGPDLFLTAWWTLDVLLAWLVSADVKWVRVQRGALHLLVFVMFFGANVVADKASGVAHFLGVVMAVAVMLCFVLRLLLREADPTSFLTAIYLKAFQFLNVFLPWYKLPTWLAVVNLAALRDVLRQKNLHNTSDVPVTRPEGLRATPPYDAKYLSEREEDGFYDDLDKVAMGSASDNPADPTNSSEFTVSTPGARFGRNIPLDAVGPLPNEKITEPSPRLVSNTLLARLEGSFTPASTLNLLAAAWIQFQTHDWFNHGRPPEGSEFPVALPPGDKWHEDPMRIRRTRPDPTRSDPNRPYPDGRPADGQPLTYANAESHWWDGSEVYGSSTQAAELIRAHQDGKLKVGPDRLVPIDTAGLEITGLTVNWWLGLSMLQNLFALEHNAICDSLKLKYPEWDDAQLYRVARLVNSALIAKIHTVDWTCAILGNPALQVAMNANWWGLAGEHVKKALGRLSDSEAISGIPGSETNHHGADYCLTEEFVSVYRMHPLMPDGIEARSAADDHLIRNLKLGSAQDNDPDDVVGPEARARALATGATMLDLFYSFGVVSPGALILRNYPNWMRRLRRMRGTQVEEIIDLAAIDILRDRERGVPRYNRFRQLFHLPPFHSIDQMIQASKQLREDPKLAAELKTIYGNDVNLVDLMVGLYAETPPEGFGFSDTAFRVFILMASRRIKSDRFLTKDYTPAVYTQAGLDWLDNNNMTSVLLRHHPELTPALQNVANPFAPWRRVAQ